MISTTFYKCKRTVVPSYMELDRLRQMLNVTDRQLTMNCAKIISELDCQEAFELRLIENLKNEVIADYAKTSSRCKRSSQ